jgi:hypothetical protein
MHGVVAVRLWQCERGSSQPQPGLLEQADDECQSFSVRDADELIIARRIGKGYLPWSVVPEYEGPLREAPAHAFQEARIP